MKFGHPMPTRVGPDNPIGLNAPWNSDPYLTPEASGDFQTSGGKSRQPQGSAGTGRHLDRYDRIMPSLLTARAEGSWKREWLLPSLIS